VLKEKGKKYLCVLLFFLPVFFITAKENYTTLYSAKNEYKQRFYIWRSYI